MATSTGVTVVSGVTLCVRFLRGGTWAADGGCDWGGDPAIPCAHGGLHLPQAQRPPCRHSDAQQCPRGEACWYPHVAVERPAHRPSLIVQVPASHVGRFCDRSAELGGVDVLAALRGGAHHADQVWGNRKSHHVVLLSERAAASAVGAAGSAHEAADSASDNAPPCSPTSSSSLESIIMADPACRRAATRVYHVDEALRSEEDVCAAMRALCRPNGPADDEGANEEAKSAPPVTHTTHTPPATPATPATTPSLAPPTAATFRLRAFPKSLERSLAARWNAEETFSLRPQGFSHLVSVVTAEGYFFAAIRAVAGGGEEGSRSGAQGDAAREAGDAGEAGGGKTQSTTGVEGKGVEDGRVAIAIGEEAAGTAENVAANATSMGAGEVGVQQQPQHPPHPQRPQQQPQPQHPWAEVEAATVCRASRKISEACRVFGILPFVGLGAPGAPCASTCEDTTTTISSRKRIRTVVDVGAAPGGWTSFLALHAERVIAVDPAAMRPDPAVVHRVEHLAMLAETAAGVLVGRGERLDMLVCDANDHPDVVAREFVAPLRGLLVTGAPVVVTLKNFWPGRGGADTAEWTRQVAEAKDVLGAFCEGLTVVHLMANTPKETTLFGRVREGCGAVDGVGVVGGGGEEAWGGGEGGGEGGADAAGTVEVGQPA